MILETNILEINMGMNILEINMEMNILEISITEMNIKEINMGTNIREISMEMNIREITKIGDVIMTMPAADVTEKDIIEETEVGQDRVKGDNTIEEDLDPEIETITDIAIEDRAGMMIIEDFHQEVFHLNVQK